MRRADLIDTLSWSVARSTSAIVTTVTIEVFTEVPDAVDVGTPVRSEDEVDNDLPSQRMHPRGP
jgi:hypothetical protein